LFDWKEITMPRPLYRIAADIRADWQPLSPHARPYIMAMGELVNIHDSYGADSAKSIVLYFLSNAGTWKGQTARTIKAELKSLAGVR
jgi:hypothetical protein